MTDQECIQGGLTAALEYKKELKRVIKALRKENSELKAENKRLEDYADKCTLELASTILEIKKLRDAK